MCVIWLGYDAGGGQIAAPIMNNGAAGIMMGNGNDYRNSYNPNRAPAAARAIDRERELERYVDHFEIVNKKRHRLLLFRNETRCRFLDFSST